MSYDAEGNLISEIWYAGSTVTNSIRYTYDGDGNILTASNDAGTSSFVYNADGEETQAIDPNGVTLNYQYDAAGNVTQITDSLGDTVTSQYDADGNLIQSSATGPDGAQLAVELSYDGDGNLTSLTRQGQVSGQLQTVGSSSYAYDAQGNVTSIIHTNAAGTTLDSFTYSYDAADELTQEVDYNGTTTAYSYDATGQLVSSGTTAYAYDANGNPSNSGDSVGANNELLTDGTWNYSYDANGNLTGKTGVSGGADAGLTWAYGYDAANELISATETNGQGQTLVQAAYTYDAFGHLLQSSVSTNGGTPVVTEFVYNGDTLWATLNGSGAIQDLYVSGDQPDQYFAQIDASSGVSWYLTDNLGSVRDTMNNSGQLLDTIAYDAYGNILSQSNSSQMPLFGYAGYVYDQSTGLNYANARWYNSQTQQWMEQDPLLLQPGPNTREYVDDEPTNATDPTGEAPLMVPKKGVFDKQIDDVQQQLANADPGSNRAKLLQIQLIYMRHEQAGMAEFVKTRDSLESNQSELVRQKIQVNNQLTEIRKQLNDLNNDLRVLEQRRENQKQRSNALPAGKEKSPEERLKDQIDAAESQITALEEQFASLEASLSDVDTNLKANQNNYTAWRTEKLQNKLQPAFALDTKNGAKSDIHRGIDAKVALDMANRGVVFFRRDPDSKDPNNLIQVPPWGLGGPTASEADEALQKEYQRLKDQEEFPELALNSLQLVLTLGELIPVVGTPIAAVNGTIYAARGMPLEASLSYLAIVPLLGDVTGATKLAKSGLTAASGLLKNTRIARGIASLAKVEPKAVEAAQLAARQRLGLALQSGETTPSAAKQLLQKAGLSPAAAAREVELAEKAVLSLKVLASKSCFVAGTPLLTPDAEIVM